MGNCSVSRSVGRRAAVVLGGCVLAASFVVPPAGAQTGDAYLLGAELWTASDCSGDVPVMVGSDESAQSDIYSAVTLAGVLGTDCVILAGARDGAMPAVQRSRFNEAAAGGYVVGGTAAVPEVKVSGRDMTRLAGADRWATARLVGSEARALADGTAPPAPTLDTTLTAPSDVQQPRVHLRGAEPWIASDCAGDPPIVVGSDAKAQSDIYSAVTLAGVIGTDCVILAGPRDGTMPVSQRARFDAAESGGFVLGGAAAVPTAKLAGRDMTRLGGATRRETAQLVGRRASGDTTAGTSTTTETTGQTSTPSGSFTAVSVGATHSCGVRSDGAVTCWGNNDHGQASAPSGKFTAVSAGHTNSCGLQIDRTVICWGNGNTAPAGSFTAVNTSVSLSYGHSCGLRTDGTLACWDGELTGDFLQFYGHDMFTYIAISGDHVTCLLRTDGELDCYHPPSAAWYEGLPPGPFTAISAGSHKSCGLRVNGTVTCWLGGDFATVQGELVAPSGSFIAISAGYERSCGLRRDGRALCWDWSEIYPYADANSGYVEYSDTPSVSFTAISVGSWQTCGLRTNGLLSCWAQEPPQ